MATEVRAQVAHLVLRSILVHEMSKICLETRSVGKEKVHQEMDLFRMLKKKLQWRDNLTIQYILN